MFRARRTPPAPKLETAVEQKDFGGGYADIRTRTGQVAQVNASGNLLLQAGENIALAGARVEGGGQTALSAGGDVTLGGLEIFSAQNSKRGYSNFTGQMGSAVKGGEVRIEAGGDVALSGSAIDAQGNAALLAGGSIDLLAAQGESHSYWKEKGGGNSRTIINDKTGLIGSGVLAGEGVVMAAGLAGAAPGNITLQASSVQAGADVALRADGNIAVLSGLESEYSYFKESHKGFMKKS